MVITNCVTKKVVPTTALSKYPRLLTNISILEIKATTVKAIVQIAENLSKKLINCLLNIKKQKL